VLGDVRCDHQKTNDLELMVTRRAQSVTAFGGAFTSYGSESENARRGRSPHRTPNLMFKYKLQI
jgi:hypothetical protein